MRAPRRMASSDALTADLYLSALISITPLLAAQGGRPSGHNAPGSTGVPHSRLVSPASHRPPPERHVVWHCARLSSCEYASLNESEAGPRLQGTVILPRDGVPCLIEYEVSLDSGWAPLSAAATIRMPAGVRRLVVQSRGDGDWSVDGVDVPHLKGCTDIDLGWTPATNTCPIRRLDVPVGAQDTITAAWVRFPELTVRLAEQHYTRLAEDRWRYQAGAYDFELVTDAASGLVVSYGTDLWQAVGTGVVAS